MRFALKIIGLVCVILTILLWTITLTTDATPGSIGAATSPQFRVTSNAGPHGDA